MILMKKIITAGINWTQSNMTSGGWDSSCVTPTGRILAGSGSGSNSGIWYSDDDGINWAQSNKTDSVWRSLCATPTGRIIAGSNGGGIWYSDDNGINWTQSNITDEYWISLCVTPTRRIIAANNIGLGIWYSDPEYTAVCTKYLDQNGAKEIVTQFKAYCDSLVGGV